MKIIVLTLLLLLCGCGFYPSGYYTAGVFQQQQNDYYWKMQANQAYWSNQINQTRQNSLLEQQNMILQQRGYR